MLDKQGPTWSMALARHVSGGVIATWGQESCALFMQKGNSRPTPPL